MRQSTPISTILTSVGHNDLVRKAGRLVLKTLNLHKPTLEKEKILKDARFLLKEKIPLDCTQRNGVVVFHNPGNTLIARGFLFEPEIQECLCCLLFLDRLRGNTSGLADIGANIGLHTIFLRQKFPTLRIAAFDPSPFSWKYMELTLWYNKIQGVSLHKIALGEHEGDVSFYTWGESSACDSLRNTERLPDVPFQLIRVRMTSLDAHPDAHILTVIKMDCEGAEVNILRGMRNLIKRNQPLIITEFNYINQRAFGLSSESVYSFVVELGYSLYTVYFQKLDRKEFTARHCEGEENFVLLPEGFTCPKISK